MVKIQLVQTVSTEILSYSLNDCINIYKIVQQTNMRHLYKFKFWTCQIWIPTSSPFSTMIIKRLSQRSYYRNTYCPMFFRKVKTCALYQALMEKTILTLEFISVVYLILLWVWVDILHWWKRKQGFKYRRTFVSVHLPCT